MNGFLWVHRLRAICGVDPLTGATLHYLETRDNEDNIITEPIWISISHIMAFGATNEAYGVKLSYTISYIIFEGDRKEYCMETVKEIEDKIRRPSLIQVC